MKRILAVAAAAIALSTTLVATAHAADAPRNDDFDRSKSISALPYSARVDVTKATQADDDPQCRNTGHSVWYSFTPDTDMRLVARVRGRRVREWVSVWQGSRGALQEVTCNEYRPIVEATAGTTYHFMVGTYRNAKGGPIRFSLAQAPPPPEFEFNVDPEGTINTETEEVTFTGDYTCAHARYYEYYGQVYQEASDRRFISAYFNGYSYGEEEECDGTTEPFTETVLGEGVFIDGRALVRVTAYACNRFECTNFTKVIPITLERQAPSV